MTYKRYKFPIVGQVRDAVGSLWHVRDIRDTRHGFDLLFGSPDSHLENYPTRLPSLIATRPLIDYWEAHRTSRRGEIYDLPAGRTTIKRVRRRLGFNVLDDTRDFYEERIDDLKKLTPRQFAARHKVDRFVARDARRRILGNIARPDGWWRTPETLDILRSHITLREIGERLSISISQAHRLKLRAVLPDVPDTGDRPPYSLRAA